MAVKPKTYGTCPGCDEYGPLTMQHIRLIPELKGIKIVLCESCHNIVTRYEIEIEKVLDCQK